MPDAGAPGALDPAFTNGLDSTATVASPGAMIIDGVGRLYVVGSLANCVGASSGSDFAVTRFTAAGALDLTFGNSQGTACADFSSGTDQGGAAALDANGNILVVGSSSISGTVTMAMTRLTPSGAIDTTFGTMGYVRLAPLPMSGTCAAGPNLCALPEAQGAVAVAYDATKTTFYVAGTSLAYPTTQFYNAGWIASFDANGGVNTAFNPTGAKGDAKMGTAGFIADDGLTGLFDLAIDGTNVVVVGTDQGSAIDGGFADKGRKFVTRRYTAAGALDTTFNASGTVPGEVRTALGTNDYAQAVRIDATSGAIVVGGTVSVGGVGATNAGPYAAGQMGAVRYTSAGVLDTSFATSGTYVGDVVLGFPGYSHNIMTTDCEGHVYLAGFSGDIAGCAGGACQAESVLRLTPAGLADSTFGPGTLGVGAISIPKANTNVLVDAINTTPDGHMVMAGGTPSGLILDQLNY
jgi:uncharacterized delta-60 repeat protein